jgi:superfamily I DNA/RNA helicase
MYLAGDDDQAIYRWSGACVDTFLNLDGGSEVLSQSYRVPFEVHNIAQRVVSRIKRRKVKKYDPHKLQGNVTRIVSPNLDNLENNSWLILAQCNYMLDNISDLLKQNGFLFDNKGRRSIASSIASAVQGWEEIKNNNEIDSVTLRNMYTYMKTGTRVKRGFKKLDNIHDTDTFTFDGLKQYFGLLATQDMTWDDALDRIPDTERSYINAILRKGLKINDVPKIKVSTIHGAKGGEAENVILYTDLSNASDRSRLDGTLEAERMSDDLHRLFYVGVTRTKNNLYLVEPEDALRSYQI